MLIIFLTCKSTRASKAQPEKKSTKPIIELKVESPKTSPIKRKREVATKNNKENEKENKQNVGNKKLKSSNIPQVESKEESFNFHEVQEKYFHSFYSSLFYFY